MTNPKPLPGLPFGIAAASASNIWAVGETADHVLVMHYNGHAWSRDTSVPAVRGQLTAVAVSGSTVWATGGLLNPPVLALRHTAAGWKVVKTPSTSGTLLGVAVSGSTCTPGLVNFGGLGWRLDADFPFDNGFRVVQFTPPGAGCSIQFGSSITSASPGSAQGLYLIVSDIQAARDELAGRGAKPSEVFHAGTPGAQFQPDGASGRVRGPAPDHATYSSFATFSDPDGNGVRRELARLVCRVHGCPGGGGGAADIGLGYPCGTSNRRQPTGEGEATVRSPAIGISDFR